MDDNGVFGSDEDRKEIKDLLTSKYGVKDMGRLDYFCGIELLYLNDGVKIHQRTYVCKLIDKFNFSNLRPIECPTMISEKGNSNALIKYEDPELYLKLVGSLNYLGTVSRPDLSFALSYVARNSKSPSKLDYQNVVNIFRYLIHTIDYGIKYRSSKSNLCGYADASYAEDVKDRKSHSGYCFILNGGAISWRSKKQKCTVLSSTEAEYVSLVNAAKECLWLKKLEEDLLVSPYDIVIYEDNTSAIALTETCAINDRTKHIGVRYHFIREKVENREFVVSHISTEAQTADVLTKSLDRVKHKRHCDGLGMI